MAKTKDFTNMNPALGNAIQAAEAEKQQQEIANSDSEMSNTETITETTSKEDEASDPETNIPSGTKKRKAGRPKKEAKDKVAKTAISIRISDDVLEKAKIVVEERYGGNLTRCIEKLLEKAIEENKDLFE